MIFSRSKSPFEEFGEYIPLEDAALTFHLYTAGESLSGLAHRYYDDWKLWRIIADRNNIDDPRQIAPGTQLTIPERPLLLGTLERN